MNAYELNAEHFKRMDKDLIKKEYIPPPKCEVDMLNLTQRQMNGFKNVRPNVWKNGNVYLKYYERDEVEVYIGQVINQLNFPTFVTTLGLVESDYTPIQHERIAKFTDMPQPKAIRECNKFIATQEVEGITLFEYLSRGVHTQLEVKSIMMILLVTLFEAYRQIGFGHGDLHPKNIILVRHNGYIKIGNYCLRTHGYLPIIIDLGSSCMTVNDVWYTPNDVDEIFLHNNYPNRSNNIGDIFRLLLALKHTGYKFIDEEYSWLTRIPKKDVLDFTKTKDFWVTPRCDEFNFETYFYRMIRKYPIHNSNSPHNLCRIGINLCIDYNFDEHLHEIIKNLRIDSSDKVSYYDNLMYFILDSNLYTAELSTMFYETLDLIQNVKLKILIKYHLYRRDPILYTEMRGVPKLNLSMLYQEIVGE